MLENHKATETYVAFTSGPVFVHCMGARKFIDTLQTFPDAKAIFVLRAQARRKHFRRIRKRYEKWVGFDGRTDSENLPQAIKNAAQKISYDNTTMPKHLDDTDFYFIDKFKDRIPDEDADSTVVELVPL